MDDDKFTQTRIIEESESIGEAIGEVVCEVIDGLENEPHEYTNGEEVVSISGNGYKVTISILEDGPELTKTDKETNTLLN